MRYIRTKDGKIINISKYKIVKRMCDGVYYRNSDKEIWRVIYVEDIKAEADTIGPLFDHFIVKDENGGYWVAHTLYVAKKQYKKGGVALYGAVWTDKGLIYVAKMNEKGELELL